MSESTFFASERQRMLREALTGTAAGKLPVSARLLEAQYRFDNEQRDARFFIVTTADSELIPYKGQPQIWTDLYGERLGAGIEPIGGAYPQVRAGKLRAIALLGAQRSALLPDVPTATEQGFTGIEADAWNALFAKAGTPATILDRLHRESARILGSADVRESLLKQGMEVEVSDPKILGQRVRDDRAKWAKVISQFNVKAED